MTDADQLRRAVLEQKWCAAHSRFADECGGVGVQTCDPVNDCPPLWARCPEVRPEGLEWDSLTHRWMAIVHFAEYDDAKVVLEDHHAAALIGWQEARLLAKAWEKREGKLAWVYHHERFAERVVEALASDIPVLDLIRLHHKLLDAQEQQP